MSTPSVPSSVPPLDTRPRDARPMETRRVVGAALVAAALGALIGLIARSLFGFATPAELFGDRVTQLIPLPIFAAMLNTFGGNAKHLYFVALLVGEALLTAAAGALYWRGREWLRAWLRTWDRARAIGAVLPEHPIPADVPAIMLLLWLFSAGLLAPILGGGFFGASLIGGVAAVFVAELLPNGVFAFALVALLRRAAREPRESPAMETLTPAQVTRRAVLRQAGLAAAILAGGTLAWEAVAGLFGGALGVHTARGRRYPLMLPDTPTRIVPPPQPSYGLWTPLPAQTPEVTGTADFYYVSKNLVGDPSLDTAGWRLSIDGLVDHPYTLSLADLQALPAVERYHTLECISNEAAGNLMSNANWSGVRLADVLNRAGIQAGAGELIFRSTDGYSDSLHLSQALNPQSLIVYLINGAPLPRAHGFPARLLIPGLYGMKNGKWLTSLELGSGGYNGYWEQQGWTREARVKTTTRIDVPGDGDILLSRSSRPTAIAGVAYTGDRGVAQVDISVDAGRTWRPAMLRRPLDALTWVLWELPWTPSAGTYTIVARTIDLDGNVQSPAVAGTLPDGASGYDAIQVIVR